MAIKKGSKEGSTAFAHSKIPSLAAVRLLFEKRTKQIVNKQKRVGNICFFKDTKKKVVFLFMSFTSSYNCYSIYMKEKRKVW